MSKIDIYISPCKLRLIFGEREKGNKIYIPMQDSGNQYAELGKTFIHEFCCLQLLKHRSVICGKLADVPDCKCGSPCVCGTHSVCY